MTETAYQEIYNKGYKKGYSDAQKSFQEMMRNALNGALPLDNENKESKEIAKSEEDVAKAFQIGLAFGFGAKYDEMDRVINEIKEVNINECNA